MAKNDPPAAKDEISLENSSLPSDSDLEYPDLEAEPAPAAKPKKAKPGPVSIDELDDGEDIQEIVFEVDDTATEEPAKESSKASGNVLPSDDDLDYPE